ncbi:peptidoglycan recognition protein family protein [Anaeromicropila populeti]|uniref:N-acetylmuramoyl-L-alanine amidase n=1 Tax=Anaeromicropila populeti TaxID=37658 RepID=A0A1I6JI83_9FIRM|nr:N-acetylmuramoyl-L-alanine amidase [Anaeromicropila populeti]SFR78736.1 Putative peptidoglycan binding domain-containing protein [Anaeromicropila populeti]
MLNIVKNLTAVNRTVKDSRFINYIVIHWVGSVSTAKNNSLYFKNINRNASAHYFVDDISIYQVVEDKNVAWHCGGNRLLSGGGTYHTICTNSNSLGIEMCLDTVGHVSDMTIQNTAELVQYLMNKYSISTNNVIRHYDVTGKQCPGAYIKEERWEWLKSVLIGAANPYIRPAKTLKKGSKGQEVQWVQWQLSHAGYPLVIDGIFGIKTEKMVAAFQNETGLKVASGVVGPKTRYALEQQD